MGFVAGPCGPTRMGAQPDLEIGQGLCARPSVRYPAISGKTADDHDGDRDGDEEAGLRGRSA